MLEGLVSPDAAELYLRMLLGEGTARQDAERPGGGSPALAELTRLGLLHTTTGLAAVDPSEAFTRLLAGIDRQTVTGHQQLGSLLRVLDGLRLDSERGASAGQPGPVIELLTDRATVARAVRQSRMATRTEYLAVVAAGPAGPPPLGWPDDVEPGTGDAAVRVLYAGVRPGHEPAHRSPGTVAAAVRFGPAAPLDIRIVDEHTSLLALADGAAADGVAADGIAVDGATRDGAERDGAMRHGVTSDGAAVDGGTRDGVVVDGVPEGGGLWGDGLAPAVVVRSEPLVGLLRSCFHVLWERAGAAVDEPAAAGWLTPFDHRVLALLAAGHRDAEIATRTGTSVRTVRRRIAVIVEQFGVTSRFAAGVQACRRGLVSIPPDPGQQV